ncbi:hypothetical protein D7Z26_12350 [Cohnella endophytica]|uniref:Uncharacterized protein n=1 Tax=Cohnella endophytica TaxID=2419778 RepID=A0A494XU62_9BACL|nr:hypothetical protein [Cohnella endophytica]RKP54161.1 hypothetical protein D7Z26_12350 [Cohnella endophytica]
MDRPTYNSDGSYTFQVEIRVSSTSHGDALQQLTRALKDADLAEFRILSERSPEGNGTKKAAVKPIIAQPDPLELRIRQYIESNKLIRLNINKGRGVKISMPCRVINFDSATQLLTAYHVDEKQVYTVKLNEIDDFLE